MIFSSTVFILLFLPLTVMVYYNPFVKKRGFRNYFLLAASLLFYAWGEPIFIIDLLISIVITFILVRIMAKRKSKKWLIVCIIYHVLNMFIFKYLSFICSEFEILIKGKIVDIALPIGISFFTFQLLSYVFDVYYGKVEEQTNIMNLGLYVSLFPQLIAGPIVRYESIANQIVNRKETLQSVLDGLERFALGLGKKVLLANYLAVLADNIFGMSNRSVLIAWIGAVSYTLQIYFDFSGYSDMAIGLGEMFGFHFEENFDYPYISKSITEFWRRWHISLSSWFRDYVYIPLGGNRVSEIRWIRNIFIVWLLTGIWHGANWTFLIWGLFYCVLLLTEKKFKYINKLGFIGHFYTLFMVILAWVMFRADNVKEAFIYIGQMFGMGAVSWGSSTDRIIVSSGFLIVSVACLAATPIYKKIQDAGKVHSIIHTAFSLWALIVFILSMASILRGMYNPFIYFNF